MKERERERKEGGGGHSPANVRTPKIMLRYTDLTLSSLCGPPQCVEKGVDLVFRPSARPM